MISEIKNMDCIEGMKAFPDKYFDLAIVDPPYGIGIMKQWGKKEQGFKEYEKKEWDNAVPDERYFNELKRVSKNQIIWGGNYFNLPPSQCWLIWDKGQRNFSMADGELAWTSFDKAMRIFTYSRGAHMAVKSNFHPTEKPVKLYSWILKYYAEGGGQKYSTRI